MKFVSLIFQFLSKNIREFMVDRGNFLIYFVTIFFYQFTGLIFIWVIFDKTPLLVGWQVFEIVFIYGFFQVVTGIFYFLFAWTLWFPQTYLIQRKMDLILSCPLNSYFHVFLQEIGHSTTEILSILLGFVIMVVSMNKLNLTVTPLFILKIVFGTISGVLLLAGIFTLFTSISFWVKSTISFVTLFMNFMDFGQYPITIYNSIIRIILTWVIPLGFIAFYPAASVLRATQFRCFIWFGLPLALFFFLCSLFLWNKGLKKYESAGT